MCCTRDAMLLYCPVYTPLLYLIEDLDVDPAAGGLGSPALGVMHGAVLALQAAH